MRVVVQRVKGASVTVSKEISGSIGQGLLLLAGVGLDDTEANLASMAEKIVNLRIFPDPNGRFHFSLIEKGYDVLVIPQFTLFADTSKGRRPEFFGAMKPPQAESLFEFFVAQFKKLGVPYTGKGVFGGDMEVSLINYGPVTICLEN